LSDTDDPASHASIQVGAVRAFIGLTQGIALYGLFEASQRAAWPATNGPLFAPLCAIAIFVPLVVALDLTELRPRLLAGWVAIVTLVCAGLAWYDVYRDPFLYPFSSSYQNAASPQLHNLPSYYLWFGLALGLFVGHSLLIAGANDGRRIARYSTYFGVSWKYGLQAAMAAAFAGVFWLVLWLGAELFRLIKIDALSQLIQKPWFWIPATSLALICAVHVTDVRVGIVRGMRTLSCTLLAWLLPLMTLIAVCFVAALPFTGLEPLWSTRYASTILLVAAASLIFLVNAAYQDGTRAAVADGSDTRPLPPPLRWAIAAASLILVPIVVLAAYGISLRVRQYGWSSERVVATACALLAALYAIGYAMTAVRSYVSLSWLEATNVATAFAIPAIILALFTPLADPARIAVADQVGRLKAGTIAPEKFDYLFLRFGAGRFGVDALRDLAAQKDMPVVAAKSAEALEKKTRVYANLLPPSPAERAGNIRVVRPLGEALPPAFLQADWNNARAPYGLSPCLTGRTKCDAVLADLDGDGIAEIILLPAYGSATVYGSRDQSWSYLGQLAESHCPGIFEAMRAGNIKPVQPTLPEFEVAGRRLRLIPPAECSANAIKR
jgi:hypothetical protein